MSEEPPSCDVRVEAIWTPAGLDLEQLAQSALVAVLERAPAGPPGPVEASFWFADDVAVQGLNAAWRGRDRTTDVLSFPASEPGAGPPPGAPVVLGDVVLAFETCTSDAASLERPLAAHVRHLLVHGLLHLLHYDHETPEAAAVMEPLEVSVLRDLGVPDPYAGRPLIEEAS